MDDHNSKLFFDVLVIGSGVSGSFISRELAEAGYRCAVFEAGSYFSKENYPKSELEGNANLYWSGGIELDKRAEIGLLRPKCVGGGSVVNQALMDRFTDEVWQAWEDKTQIPFTKSFPFEELYTKAESSLNLERIPSNARNRNAQIFTKGLENKNLKWKPLRRAQKNCFYEGGNDCIECLRGCPRDSKQSMPITVLREAVEKGATLFSNFEVKAIGKDHKGFWLEGNWKKKNPYRIRSKRIVLASGVIGNTKILSKSFNRSELPSLGEGFYTHPQFMSLAHYKEPVDAFRGPFQAVHSHDPSLREHGFKLENVFAGPVGLSMLLPGHGKEHQELMKNLRHYACIEVAIRDTYPGRIRVSSKGKVKISKPLNSKDRLRKSKGLSLVREVFESTGAEKVFQSHFGIGLHLMGGCAMGVDPNKSVVDPGFQLHGKKGVFIADSSVFPEAPGINPSLSIMALSLQASKAIIETLEKNPQ